MGARGAGGSTLDESNAEQGLNVKRKIPTVTALQPSKFWMCFSQKRESRLSTLTVPDTATGQYNVDDVQNDGKTPVWNLQHTNGKRVCHHKMLYCIAVHWCSEQ